MASFDAIDLSKEKYQSGWLRAYERQTKDPLWKPQPIEFLPKYVQLFRTKGIKRILDACCGDGRNSIYMLREGFSVVGLDLSAIALEKAFGYSRELLPHNGFFVQGDVELLPSPFPHETFDALVCLDAFGQILEIEKVLSGFKAIVRRDGYILMNLYTPEDAAYGEGERIGDKTYLFQETLFRFFTEDDLNSLFRRFEIVEVTKLRWDDPPHLGYRNYSHTHDSLVVLLRN